jgi:hypothetical protein
MSLRIVILKVADIQQRLAERIYRTSLRLRLINFELKRVATRCGVIIG